MRGSVRGDRRKPAPYRDADEDACPAFGAVLALLVPPLGGDKVAGPWGEGGKGDAVTLVHLLDARGVEVFHHHRGKVDLFT